MQMELVDKIKKLKEEKNALILAHYYQVPEIQDIADFVGDSLALAQKAATTQAAMIVLAGVHFMAETAKILNPHKKVLLPDSEAGCSLADSCPASSFKDFLKHYPKHTVISYINCTAEVKTLSDLICTSGNAVQLVESFPKDHPIVFAPDRNLGGYINRLTGRNMVLWDGSCEVHDVLSTEAILNLKEQHPDAKLVAHPECKAAVLELADFIGSTTALLSFTSGDASKKYIVATETGILHKMRQVNPEKEFYIVPSDKTCLCNDCPYMKLNTLEKLYQCLLNETPVIELSDDIMLSARKPIDKMLEMSLNLGIIK